MQNPPAAPGTVMSAEKQEHQMNVFDQNISKKVWCFFFFWKVFIKERDVKVEHISLGYLRGKWQQPFV